MPTFSWWMSWNPPIVRLKSYPKSICLVAYIEVILYDIACHFETYLKSRMSSEDFLRLRFGVSIFHMYGHEFKCQIRYSPRWLSGLGLTDGESCERCWGASRYQIGTLAQC